MRIQNLIQVQILGYLSVRSDKNNADFVQKRLARKKMLTYYALLSRRKRGRAVECNGLENRRGLIPLREFESHRFRQVIK